MMIRSLVRHIADRLELTSNEGTEIVEFAVSLPLLIVLVVGIYDFGSAFTLRQRLNSSVREGVRLASSQTHPQDIGSGGSCTGAPSAICTVRDIVAQTLLASNVNDCGLGTADAMHPSYLTWTFTGTCGGPTLQIASGNVKTTTLPSPFDTDPYVVEDTEVTLVYPYQWQFSKAFQLLTGNANYLGSTITVTSTMQNIE